jgi:plastocyanin
MRPAVGSVCGVLLIGLAMQGPNPSSEGGGAGKTVMVDISGFKFPPNVTVNVGDSIVWNNKDNAPHHPKADATVPADLAFDAKRVDGGKATAPVPFKKAGVIPYHCEIHKEMKGTITVQGK